MGKKREEAKDDGRVIADMSGIDAPSVFSKEKSRSRLKTTARGKTTP